MFPAGISYADRFSEEAGDYKRLAFLPYGTLVLSVARGCPPELRREIERHAATVQAREGQALSVSTCGQTVRLGSAVG